MGKYFWKSEPKFAENVDEIFFEIARKLPKLEVNHSNAQCTHNWKNSSWRGRQTKGQNVAISEMIFCVIYYIFCEFSTATHITSFLFEILNLGNNYNSYLV